MPIRTQSHANTALAAMEWASCKQIPPEPPVAYRWFFKKNDKLVYTKVVETLSNSRNGRLQKGGRQTAGLGSWIFAAARHLGIWQCSGAS